MQIRRTYIILLCLALPLLTMEAQAQTNTLGEFNKHVVEKWSNDYIRVSRFRVKGSPYLLGESFPGNIVYADGSMMSNVQVLYDIYSQKAGMEVGKEMVQPGSPVKEFSMTLADKFGGDLLVFKPASAYEDGKQGYMNVMAEGKKASLLKLFASRLVSDPANMYSNDIKMFEQYADYYVYLAGKKEVVKVKLGDKALIKALGSGANLKEYIIAEKLDVSTEKGAIKLLNYFNSLD